MSQSPEGSTANCDDRDGHYRSVATWDMSQSPEGSTANCDRLVLGKGKSLGPRCLNPPKGRRPIATYPAGLHDPGARRSVSTPRRVDGQSRLQYTGNAGRYGRNVSIPRRVDGQLRRNFASSARAARTWMSQSPEGSTANCDALIHPGRATRISLKSQSPEGSTANCDVPGKSLTVNADGSCLNPPKGRRPIATCKRFATSVKMRLSLNPPKGRRPIATRTALRLTGEVWAKMSQSPEGSTANCDEVLQLQHKAGNRDVSIPRRVDGQLRHLLRHEQCRSLAEGLNPSKGRRPIATCHDGLAHRFDRKYVSIPRRVDGQLRRV